METKRKQWKQKENNGHEKKTMDTKSKQWIKKEKNG